jgi:hypothetical protein
MLIRVELAEVRFDTNSAFDPAEGFRPICVLHLPVLA